MKQQSSKTFLILTIFLLRFLTASRLAEDRQPSSTMLSLNGEWTFSIHGHGHKKMTIPSTYLPVGGATLETKFTLPQPAVGRRVLARFEGIVMTGEVFVNGIHLGQYGPYTPFTLDITEHVKPSENQMLVNLTDIGGFEPWGRGWVTAFPRYGGIIRDVTLEVKTPVYIENARLD